MSFGAATERGVENGATVTSAGVRTYIREFQTLSTDAVNDTEYGAVSASGIPALNAAHPGDSGARVKSKQARRLSEDGRLLWIVTVTYSSSTATTTTPDDPTDRDPVISTSSRPFEFIPTAYFSGTNWENGILNSAGDAFDPPPSIPKALTVLNIQMNLAAFDLDDIFDFRNTVNDDTITVAGKSFAARQLYMEDITARKATENGVDYYDVNYTILCADIDSAAIGATPVATNTHDLVLLNQGYFQVVSGTKAPCLILQTGENATVPQLLAADGTQLSLSGDPVWLSFRVRREVDWDPIGLPTTF